MSREDIKEDMREASEELPEVVSDSLEAYEGVVALSGGADYPRDEIKDALKGQQGEIHFSGKASEMSDIPLINGMEGAEVSGTVSRRGIDGTVSTEEDRLTIHIDAKGTQVSMTDNEGFQTDIHIGSKQSVQFTEHDEAGNVVSRDGIETTRNGYRAYSTEHYNGNAEHTGVDVRFKRNGDTVIRTMETLEQTYDDGSRSVSEERVKYKIGQDGNANVTTTTIDDGKRDTKKEKATLSPQQMEMLKCMQMGR